MGKMSVVSLGVNICCKSNRAARIIFALSFTSHSGMQKPFVRDRERNSLNYNFPEFKPRIGRDRETKRL